MRKLSVVSWRYFVLDHHAQLHINGASRGRRDRDRVVVGFTTTCAISAYHR